MNKLEFQEANHSYTLGGKNLISVTQAIKLILGEKYEGVAEEVLATAASYGTKIHELIERLEKGQALNYLDLSEKEMQTIEDYKRIKNFESKHVEHRVHYKDLYAGTIDGVGENIIYDIKTTASVEYDYITLQLSLYLMAYDEKNYDSYKAYCLHFPKRERAKKIRVALLEKDAILKIIGIIEDKLGGGENDE
ncbi:hypothetical protein [Gemella sp. zg-1178]|uniref:hypothetical protein n=1 Tax=Gemella sp. zg-1178 TaxID=2840372 RepID=UPI001C055496|nr:hypothetical protein [Gemella sp. zg-1178]MBU0279287.1 hypothetical protein [Gemella sp. zg-1178]